MPQALILEDDSSSLTLVSEVVENEGYIVHGAETLKDAYDSLRDVDPDVVLLDLMLPDGCGLDLLGELDGVASCPQVVVMSGHAALGSPIEALPTSVIDYLRKPVEMDRLKLILANVARTRELRDEISKLRDELRCLGRFGSLVGGSRAMQRVYDRISRVAPTSANVLITGESGTGKGLAAETIHRLSRRRSRPLVRLECGALGRDRIESELSSCAWNSGAGRVHKGHFEHVEGDTIFVDEITDVPIDLQARLKRVLETSTTSPIVRALVTTKQQPEDAVQEGRLREDLFDCLQAFPVRMPPLRDREGDVELLASHFLRQSCSEYDTQKTLSGEALEVLRRHSWPGNVRELKSVLNRAFITAGREITASSLPAFEGGEDGDVGDSKGAVRVSGDTVIIKAGSTTLASCEKGLILASLEKCGGNKVQAAKSLGISVRTLYNRLRKYRKRSG